ncbi:MAG: AEC family transporter [Proteobacteria bacterium]|nr:AEC family transporter [Pseudomonadota bacterium]
MLPIVLAILPIFILIFLGYGLRRLGVLGEGFWRGAERLVYFVLFPPLLFTTLAGADFAALAAGELALAMVAGAGALMVLLSASRPVLGIDGPAFTSLAQGALRQNTYIGFSAAFALFGTDGLAAAAIWVAAVTPIANVYCIGLLVRHGTAAEPGVRAVTLAVLKNPIILASVAGAGVNLAGLALPSVADEVLAILARGALPLGLLAVGAGLDFAAVRKGGRALPLAVVAKLAVLPLFVLVSLQAFAVTGLGATVALLIAGLPTAPTSYILARQLGGDARLLAGIITVQTACAMVTLPLVVTLLG